jgi:hypothetical protein
MSKSEKPSKPNSQSKKAATVREKGAAGEISAEDLEKVTGGAGAEKPLLPAV